MRERGEAPSKSVSMRVTLEVRKLMDRLLVHLVTKRQKPHTLTDIVVEAVQELARKEGLREQ